jgi:hypothetical protein
MRGQSELNVFLPGIPKTADIDMPLQRSDSKTEKLRLDPKGSDVKKIDLTPCL